MSENQDITGLFEKVFYNILNEDMAAGDGGVFGSGSTTGQGGAFGNSDFYAPGDNRMPKILGTSKKKPKKRKKKKKKKASKKTKRKTKKKARTRKMEEDTIAYGKGPVSTGSKTRRTYGIQKEEKIPVARRSRVERIAL